MARIHKSVEIKAPVKEVYDYLEDPEKEPEWLTSLMDVKDVTGSGTGKHFKWTYKMAGIRFNGESTFVKDIPEKQIVVESKGGIDSKWNWTFNSEPSKGITVLDLDLDYTIPVPVLGKLAEKVIMKRNERETDLNLMNIKEKLEAR
jgi:uncharacterized membrane protein